MITKGMGLLGTTSMTPMERKAGRFMRAPDHPGDSGMPDEGGDESFDLSPDLAAQQAEAEPKEEAPEPEDADEEDTDDGDNEEDTDEEDTDDDDSDDEEDEKPKKKGKSPSDRIRQTIRKMREMEKRAIAAEAINAANNKPDLPAGEANDNTPATRVKPDPSDFDKYPLGSLDSDYIEDMIEFVSDEKTDKAINAVLHREKEQARQQEAEALLTDLREKADTVASRGTELHDDYQETVVDAGLRGDYDLTQTTFEAVSEAEHGAQILYDLARDRKEATRVAGLSAYQQLKYVSDKNAEFGGSTSKARVKPKAGNPPKNAPKGSSARHGISPDTDNLDDFEKLFYKK